MVISISSRAVISRRRRRRRGEACTGAWWGVGAALAAGDARSRGGGAAGCRGRGERATDRARPGAALTPQPPPLLNRGPSLPRPGDESGPRGGEGWRLRGGGAAAAVKGAALRARSTREGRTRRVGAHFADGVDATESTPAVSKPPFPATPNHTLSIPAHSQVQRSPRDTKPAEIACAARGRPLLRRANAAPRRACPGAADVAPTLARPRASRATRDAPPPPRHRAAPPPRRRRRCRRRGRATASGG